MKVVKRNAIIVIITKAHYEIVDGFNSTINGANIVINRAKKLTVPNAVETREVLKRC